MVIFWLLDQLNLRTWKTWRTVFSPSVSPFSLHTFFFLTDSLLGDPRTFGLKWALAITINHLSYCPPKHLVTELCTAAPNVSEEATGLLRHFSENRGRLPCPACLGAVAVARFIRKSFANVIFWGNYKIVLLTSISTLFITFRILSI